MSKWVFVEEMRLNMYVDTADAKIQAFDTVLAAFNALPFGLTDSIRDRVCLFRCDAASGRSIVDGGLEPDRTRDFLRVYYAACCQMTLESNGVNYDATRESVEDLMKSIRSPQSLTILKWVAESMRKIVKMFAAGELARVSNPGLTPKTVLCAKRIQAAAGHVLDDETRWAFSDVHDPTGRREKLLAKLADWLIDGPDGLGMAMPSYESMRALLDSTK